MARFGANITMIIFTPLPTRDNCRAFHKYHTGNIYSWPCSAFESFPISNLSPGILVTPWQHKWCNIRLFYSNFNYTLFSIVKLNDMHYAYLRVVAIDKDSICFVFISLGMGDTFGSSMIYCHVSPHIRWSCVCIHCFVRYWTTWK